MLVSEAKLREKFYNEHKYENGKEVSRKKLKAMFYKEKKAKMGVVASANVQRSGSRKVGRVLQLIRGKSIDQAIAIIKFTPKRAARLIEKVLISAKANAENNNNLDAENLVVSRAYVEQGPTIPRIRPMSMGRVGRIRKRTCSTFIVLKEKKEKIVPEKPETTDDKKSTAKKATKNTRTKKAPAAKKTTAAKATKTKKEKSSENA